MIAWVVLAAMFLAPPVLIVAGLYFLAWLERPAKPATDTQEEGKEE